MSTKEDIAVIYENGKSKQPPVSHISVDFENALTMTGFGKFQILIVITSGLIFGAAGFQNGLNAYVMPSAQCDLELGSGEKGLLNAVFLAGSVVSSFLWGILADHVGRKKVLVWTLLLDGFFTIVSSLSQSFHVFAAFRFLNGFLSGGPGSIVLAYLGEFIGLKHRSPCLVITGFFWTLSWMLLPAIALAVIPITWSYHTDDFTYNSWRIFVAIFGLPSIFAGCILAVMFPESPKFLYSQGRDSEALEVLRGMYEYNYGERLGDYPVKSIIDDSSEDPRRPSLPSIIVGMGDLASPQQTVKLGPILRGVWDQIRSLFSPSLIKATALAASLCFTNMFGYYGLGLWLPEVFNRFDEHYSVSNVSVSFCELTQLQANSSSQDDWENCEQAAVNPSVFLNTFITGASCLLGTLVTASLSNTLGFKTLTIITMFISGSCGIGIYFLRTTLENLIVSCVFLATVAAANAVICSTVVDMFPTKVRALALCTAIFSGRMAAVFSNLTLGYLVDLNCEVPVFLMGALIILGGFLGFLIPNKKEDSAKKTPG